jgi:hypothetical protein
MPGDNRAFGERAEQCNQYLRHAFSVPAVVTDDHVADVIARSMIDAEPGISDATFVMAFDHARRYVVAFTQAFLDGNLDLALSGHGAVLKDATESHPRKDMSLEDTALSAIDVGEERARLDWLTWLWSTLSLYVHDHLFNPE